MKKRPVIVLGGILIAVSGVAAFVALSIRTQAAPAVRDPRQEPPIVRLATATQVAGSGRESRATSVFASPARSWNGL